MRMKMANSMFIFSISYIIFFLPFLSADNNSNNSSCPIDFSYVKTFPWYTQGCQQLGGDPKTCCQTLRSLLRMGLAIYLKKTSNFYLPTAESASSCLSLFQSKLTAFSITLPLVPSCFNSSDELLNEPTSCAGIRTIQDWSWSTTAQLDSSCRGDMGRLTQCSSCLDAGMKMTSQLVSLSPNSTKCFYFTIFYAAGILNQFGPEDVRTAACILGLPLANSDVNNDHSSSKMSRSTTFKLVFSLLGALFGAFVAIGLISLCTVCYNKRKERELHDEFVSSVRSRVLPNIGATWFLAAELERATNGFSSRNFIGRGGFGVVYKGTFSNGSVVAVKQVTEDLESMRDEEFCNEVEIISKIRHRNLLPLRGCCVASDKIQGTRRYLVYDYMPNGNLSDHLFNPRKILSWPQRKNIILDVAKGLAYLHYGVKPSIYHRDIKCSNILLDSEMKVRVADFGTVKQSTEGQSRLTTRVAGTYGYLAPEYALYGQLTEKSDVYSFGIVILETMSGRKVLDTSNTSSSVLIADFAWDLVRSGKMNVFFDEAIRDEGPKGIMERFVRVGILCAHVMVAFRPTIAEAIKMLEGDIDIPKIPNRPMPLTHESFGTWRSSSTSMGARTSTSVSTSAGGII